jgi:hypothetical protein
VESGGSTTTTICFNPIDLKAIRLVILTVITVVIAAETATDAIRRHSVDVWNDASVCTGDIKIELNVTAVQVECRFRSSTSIALNAPTTILNLHSIAIRHDKITSTRAVHLCHGKRDRVQHQTGLHGS